MKLDDLLAKARAATPGPWNVGKFQADAGYTVWGPLSGGSFRLATTGHAETFDRLNAAYIAAANPQTLISLIEGYQGAVEALRELLSRTNAVPAKMKGFEFLLDAREQARESLATFDALNAEEPKP